MTLTDAEKHVVATGLVLAHDYLKVVAPADEQINVTVYIAKLVEKLGVRSEHSKACAETSGLAHDFQALVRSKRR